jgi:transposase
MAKTFRNWDIEQLIMFPPSVQDFVPKGHLAHFIRNTTCEALDLSAILNCYSEERGYPPYHPAMMTALLLYAYCQGIYSSRRIAKACQERVDFMAITGMQMPDFRTISDFRKRHLAALGELFVQVLRLCQQAGLVKLGHVALDGTKVKANASKHKAMSYQRMKKAEAELEEIVSGWLRQAETSDAREDQEHGAELSGEDLPDWVQNKQRRLEKIREARARLEAEARAQASQKEAEKKSGGPGRPSKNEPGTPKDSAQSNFTDPESRIMKSHDGFIQGYNAQAAVDAGSQVIVAQMLTNNASDMQQLAPMVAQIKQNTGRQAQQLSADAGYCSEDNLKEINRRHIEGYVATGRQKHGEAPAAKDRKVKLGTRAYAMWLKLCQGGHRSRYRLRKQTVEPVFGQIKQGRGFRQFLLRGIRKVSVEWSLICTAHNLLKLAAAWS